MPYTPNPLDATAPLDTEQALSAAAEFRALKAYIGKLPVVPVSGNKTMAAVDMGSAQLHPAADTSTRTWLLPDNSAVPISDGSMLTVIVQAGAGTVLFGMAGGDSLTLIPTGATGTRSLPPNSVTNFIKIAPTAWICVTNGGS